MEIDFDIITCHLFPEREYNTPFQEIYRITIKCLSKNIIFVKICNAFY